MTEQVRPPDDAVQVWRNHHAEAASDWAAVTAVEQARDSAVVPQWTLRLEHLRAAQRDLVQAGRWRSGPRTLLAALDLQYRELAMTAGLAWLLRPDGHHGLGSSVLSALLTHLGFNGTVGDLGVRVVLEEQREGTRADLVVYSDAWTVVVEAKTFAVEQNRQLDRLYGHWCDEPDPHFVFLTRGPQTPISAVDSRERWEALAWQQVAVMAREAATAMTGVAPGVYDYIATLEAYHRV